MSAAAGAVVTVAIPVRNGGAPLAGVLDAVRAQRVDAEVELLVADSASSDGSRERALDAGARVIDIARGEFGHGATRNLLMREARGARVALLTQDAEPADEQWLRRLLEAFDAAEDVGLAFGPYLARPGASPAVRRELERWFGSLAPGVERLGADERDLAAVELMGRRGFFSDANACIDRAAWERVPFRDIAYAEDRALALDMLRAGFAKVYEPRAAVLHSHAYGPCERFRRVFDEWSGLREVYGWREPASPARLIGRLRGELGARRREGAGAGTLAAAGCGELSRYLAAVLGSRSGELPGWLRRSLSLESRRR
ncbi:MAG TPA: glycosyltransferase family A protein [Solirubrobacteraceae bacterium]|nr:glycosyltransferase family A protein [Solirubrobacteraceae bacterium]